MNIARALHRFTEEQYLAIETADVEKHEFYDGHILAMSGASPRHVDVCMNVYGLLRDGLRGRPCRESGSDQRVYIESAGIYTYPDATVSCGARDWRQLRGKVVALVNPTVLIEVLSDTTREYDAGEKLELYKTIPSVTDVLLIDLDPQTITRWTRGPRGWTHKTFTKGTVAVQSIGVSLPLAEVFRDVEKPLE